MAGVRTQVFLDSTGVLRLLQYLGVSMSSAMDWTAIVADPRFQALQRRKARFLWGLMAISLLYYFALPVGAAYYQNLFKMQVWGVINVGLLFALSEFVVAWLIAFYYSRVANRDFDRLAAEIVADFAPQEGG